MENEDSIIFGLLKGKLIHISEAENGLNCHCLCPGCGERLIANNQGTAQKAGRRVLYFSHYYPDHECDGGKEKALHRFSKEVFKETKTIFLPPFFYGNHKVTDSMSITFDRVEIENDEEIRIGSNKTNDLIKPDAIAYKNGQAILIEFALTHFTDYEKVEKLKKHGISCVEVNLQKVGHSKEEIANSLVQEDRVSWIYNAKAPELIQLDSEKRAAIENENILNDQRLLRGEGYLMVNIIEYKGEKFVKCPNYKEDLQAFLKTELGRNSLIQRIVNGDSWNGKIYGKARSERFIYLQNKKVKVRGRVPNEGFRKYLIREFEDIGYEHGVFQSHGENWATHSQTGTLVFLDEKSIYFDWEVEVNESDDSFKIKNINEGMIPKSVEALEKYKKVRLKRDLSTCRGCRYYKAKVGEAIFCGCRIY